MFGPRKTDAFAVRADVLVALGQVVDPKAGKKLAMRSGSREVVPSPSGRSAWVFDNVNINGEPHAVMAILTNSDDIWLVQAVSVAHTPSHGTIREEGKKDAIVPTGAAGAKKNEAEDAVDRFKKGLTDQAMVGEDLGSRTEAVYIGPSVGELVRGKKEIKKVWKKRVDAKARAAASGDITSAVTADGELAWVSAPITYVEDKQDPLPLRAFAIYEKGSEGWKLIALQEALAIDAPGAGASFKKILPPAPVEEKPPEEPKKDDKAKKDEPKKKKKKKKKKKSDDG